MAVTTSSGNGFALYNGVKLPKLPEWDKVKYPHALITEQYGITALLCTSVEFIYYEEDGVGAVTNLACSYYSYTIQDGEWIYANSYDAVPDMSWLLEFVPWSNYDIFQVDASGITDTVYLSASDPIPLEGYTVIEWDGDTTGLESAVDVAFFRVADYVKPTSAVGVYYAVDNPLTVATNLDFVDEDGIWSCGDYVMGTDGTLSEFGSSGIYFIGLGADYYTTLFAYRSAEEPSEPSYDRTAFLSGLAMGLCGKGDPISAISAEDAFTKGYKAGAALRRKRRLPVWETLWDGAATSGSFIGGNFFWLWQGTGENLLSNGDMVQIAVDGVVSTLTVRGMTSLNGAVEAGNQWLEEGAGSDDGTDVYLWEYNGSLRFFTRKSYFGELPYVKFERATYSLPVYE